MNARPCQTLLSGLVVAFNLLAAPAPASASARFPYQACFEIASQLHQVPVDLLLAVAATESNWDADARSHANAHGIMQIQWPGTARHLGVSRISELYNPCVNIELGARYLRELLERTEGDVDRALAAYNYGPTRIEGASELPPGAVRYVATVSAHRSKINRGADAQTRRMEQQAIGGEIRFDHEARARRFAELLSRQVPGARFVCSGTDDGRYAVTLLPGAQGLSLADAGRLRALGWPALATRP